MMFTSALLIWLPRSVFACTFFTSPASDDDATGPVFTTNNFSESSVSFFVFSGPVVGNEDRKSVTGLAFKMELFVGVTVFAVRILILVKFDGITLAASVITTADFVGVVRSIIAGFDKSGFVTTIGRIFVLACDVMAVILGFIAELSVTLGDSWMGFERT